MLCSGRQWSIFQSGDYQFGGSSYRSLFVALETKSLSGNGLIIISQPFEGKFGVVAAGSKARTISVAGPWSMIIQLPLFRWSHACNSFAHRICLSRTTQCKTRTARKSLCDFMKHPLLGLNQTLTVNIPFFGKITARIESKRDIVHVVSAIVFQVAQGVISNIQSNRFHRRSVLMPGLIDTNAGEFHSMTLR